MSNDDDIEAILKIAVSQAGGIEAQSLRERLMLSAAELGLTPEQVAAAEDQWAAQEKERRDLAEFAAYRKRAFWNRFVSFAILGASLLAINLLTDRSILWAPWLLLFMGLSIIRRAIGTFFPGSDRFQTAFERWRANRDALPEAERPRTLAIDLALRPPAIGRERRSRHGRERHRSRGSRDG